jgi:hypothetical protein
LFAEAHHASLRSAASDYAWLLTRGYAEDSALKLVGDRYALTARQRTAVMRCSCSDQALGRRRETEQTMSGLRGRHLAIDGYNLLITLESALSGGLMLVGRDGCFRDLASMHGTYRKVAETARAVELIAEQVRPAAHVDFYLDRPVSNSGRLKTLIAEWLEALEVHWNIELLPNPDRQLVEHPGLVVSSDSWILDRCAGWINLAAQIVTTSVPGAWIVRIPGPGAHIELPI